MRILRLMASASLVAAGCAANPAPPRAAPTEVVASTAEAMSPAGDGVMGRINGQPIRYGALSDELKAKLVDMDNEHGQRRLHLLWVGVEEAVVEVLLAEEARRRGVSVEELRETEITSKVGVPEEAELRAFYDRIADRIPVSYEEAKPTLAAELADRRATEREAELVEQLRGTAEIVYELPLPELPRYDIQADAAPSKGPEDASVTLVEFSDFQCPYCAQARRLLDRLAKLYPEDLKVVHRDFPLRQHPQARPAAEAAQCAHEQGQFWPYHDLLFENPEALAGEDLKRYAADLGLDVGAFEACQASDRPKQAVLAHEAAGRRHGVDGTPALFLNGIKLIGLLPLPVMQALVDGELGRLKRQ